MANSYTQIHLQFVFAVKHREGFIHHSWKEELFKYITGIVQDKKYKHKMLAINGVADHIHLLVGFRPDQSISDFMQDVKGSSSKWINSRNFLQGHFEWQSGYGAFSYSKSDVKKVIQYIKNQEEHHRVKFFREEYMDLLKEHEIDFDERYIFHELL